MQHTEYKVTKKGGVQFMEEIKSSNDEVTKNHLHNVDIPEETLRKEYPQTFQEDEDKEQQEFEKKMGENMKYVEMLKNSPYYFSKNGLERDLKGWGAKSKLSNVLVIPIKKINIDDGTNFKSYIELKAFINTGEELPSIKVPIEQIERNNFYNNPIWGIKVIFAKSSYKEEQRNCIKVLGKNLKEETIFGFTGMKEINGETVFLHSGGAIGTSKNIKVELGDEVLNRYKFTDKQFNKQDAFKVAFACLETAPLKITVPLFSIEFLAPLSSTFDKVGIPTGFLTWVQGPQQCKKTSIVSAFNSFFGNFDRNHAPLSFLDGVPSIINKAAKLRDIPSLCDDYFPSANKQEATHMQKVAQTLISLSFDRLTGSRSKSNGTLRKNPRQNSMVIGTGEFFPELGQSRTSRVLFLNLDKTDVNNEKLRYIQTHQEELQFIMKWYIQDFISDFSNKEEEIITTFSEKTTEASEDISFRTAEMIASLYVGYKMFLNFSFKNKVISSEEKEKKLNEAWSYLMLVGKEQNETVEKISPTNMVMEAIEALISIKKIYVVDIKSAPYIKPKDIYKPEFIGFYDEERSTNFVFPEILYKKIRDFYKQQGVDFPFNQATICKELKNSGYLYMTPKQVRPQIRINNPITKREQSTIGILQEKLYIPCIYNENGELKEK